jgi:hypothetical protein
MFNNKIMKRVLFLTTLSFILITLACKDIPIDPITKAITPARFRIKIPDAISSPDLQKSIKTDTIQGEDIYKMLRYFIYAGDASATLVEQIIISIQQNNITEAGSSTYVGDDGRTKDIVITESVSYDSNNWDFFMEITDEGNEAMQLFWNADPIYGICIFKPAEMNHDLNQQLDAMYKVEYSEEDVTYDKTMEISICSLDSNDIFFLKSMKMFVGKKGNIIDLFGNSCHPNAILVSTQGGIDWAFIAQADDSKNIAIADVCLPPLLCTTNINIMTDYSIFNVYVDEMTAAGITDTMMQQAYLYNSQSPAYFGEVGFAACGTNVPSAEYNSLSLNGLKPYIPSEIYYMNIIFDNN